MYASTFLLWNYIILDPQILSRKISYEIIL